MKLCEWRTPAGRVNWSEILKKGACLSPRLPRNVGSTEETRATEAEGAEKKGKAEAEGLTGMPSGVHTLWHATERWSPHPAKQCPISKLSTLTSTKTTPINPPSSITRRCGKRPTKPKIEVTHALRRVTRLMLAVDVVRQQQWKHEDISEEQDKTLKDLTTDDSEVWFHQYDQAADDIEEAAVAACAMVIEKRSEAKAKKIEAKEHCTLLNFARDQAREAFDKQQAEAKASA